ncbi:MAG: hypothetical protein ACREDO_03485 [Methyloceanibacter sp.]
MRSGLLRPLGGNPSGRKPGTPGPDRLTIVLVGDAGFNPDDATVEPDGVRKKGQVRASPRRFREWRLLIDGDLAFVNLETVVTDRIDNPPDSKGQTAPYSFRTIRTG